MLNNLLIDAAAGVFKAVADNEKRTIEAHLKITLGDLDRIADGKIIEFADDSTNSIIRISLDNEGNKNE